MTALTGWVFAAGLYLLGGIGLYAVTCDINRGPIRTRWKRWLFVIWPTVIVTQMMGDFSDAWFHGECPNWLKRPKPQGPVDWPPMRSALGLPDGTRQHGSAGQPWQVRNGVWVRMSK